MFGVGPDQVHQRLFLPALRRADLHASAVRRAALLAQQLLQRLAVLEIHRHVNLRRDELLVEIELLQQRGEELRLVEFLLVLPEELAPVDDLAVAQVKQVQRHQRRFRVAAENVDVVALGGRHLLPLFDLLDGGQQVAQRGRFLESHLARRRFHAPAQIARQVGVPALQKLPHVAHRGVVRLARGQALHARPQAAVNVVLQTGLGVVARQVHLARRHQKMAVDEMHQPVRQVGREVGTEIGGAVLAQAPRHVHTRVALAGQLDVGVGFVVAQQHVEARLVLLDQVVFERQRFLFVIHQNVVDIARFRDQAARFGISQLVFGKVAAHPMPQHLGFADVDDPAAAVLVQIHARRQRELRCLVTEVHRRERYN